PTAFGRAASAVQCAPRGAPTRWRYTARDSMRPLVALVIVLALVIAAAAVGRFTSPPRPDAADTSASTAAPAAPPASTPPTRARGEPTRSRSGKTLPLSEAMKDLDLIRPARAKLAEDFTLPMPGGGTFKLSEHRVKVIMVNFWATWCPPCLEEMPAMERLYRQQKAAGFTLVAVSVGTEAKQVAAFAAKHKLTLPIAL